RRLGLRSRGGLFGFPLGARRDLLRSFPRRPQKPLNLVLGLLEGVPYRRWRRAPHLELRNHAIDALDIVIDGGAVVATDGGRKVDVKNVLRYVVLQPPRARPFVGLARLVSGHDPEYANAWHNCIGSQADQAPSILPSGAWSLGLGGSRPGSSCSRDHDSSTSRGRRSLKLSLAGGTMPGRPRAGGPSAQASDR